MRKFVLLLSVVFGLTAVAQVPLQVPPPSKVIMVMLENIPYSSINSTSMPFVYNLTGKKGANLTQYYAATHPSIGNYFAVTMGMVFVNSDGYTSTIFSDNLPRRFTMSGVTFKSYAESLPYAGYTAGDRYPYVLRHNPFAYFSDVRNSSLKSEVIVPFTQFATDFNGGNLPQFSMIVPNQHNNVHDCPAGVSTCTTTQRLQNADNWIKNKLGAVLASADFQPGGKGVFIVWFDESAKADTAFGGGHVFSSIISPMVKPGNYPTHYNHYNMLRTILRMFNMDGSMGNVYSYAPITEIWTSPTGCDAPVAAYGTVSICSPKPNPYLTKTPFSVMAAARAPSGIKYMQLYIDGVKVGTYYASSIQVSISKSAGSHRLTVQALDNAGGLTKQTVNITVVQ